MTNAVIHIPEPTNEPLLGYAPGTPERKSLKAQLKEMLSTEIEVPILIGGKEIRTGDLGEIRVPHDHGHLLGRFHKANAEIVTQAEKAAGVAWKEWSVLDWRARASVFLKMADLLAGKHRMILNASTMLGQSKTAHQAEIDSAAELVDFYRFNTYYMQQIYSQQPISGPGMWNYVEYRALEGFVFAVTPFNFTSIGGNLPTSPALMGNTVLWKPASTAVYSGYYLMKLFQEAGFPDGVINFIPGSGGKVGGPVMDQASLAGIHFTGSTEVFHDMWVTLGKNIKKYKTYPRVVGETGGKNFVFVHPSAQLEAVVTGLLRGAFEYQGQKCSAASRAYIPSNLWKQVQEGLQRDIASFKMGTVEDFSNFINAVIDEDSFDKITSYIQRAKKDRQGIIAGGNSDKKTGYFIEPTVIVAKKPDYVTMREEIFGPVLTVHVYPEKKFEDALELVNATSPYGLTGAIFSQDRKAISHASQKLRHAAGNFYINDKPTGAVVGQQPFGGARASGTNDKAGSYLNLIRWTSPRAIKENLEPPQDYRYPFMREEG